MKTAKEEEGKVVEGEEGVNLLNRHNNLDNK